MRVIAGTARRLLLKTPEGNNTRPTSDKIKETLFNILQFDLQDAKFLDLFSGSGGIGIEALSRGARFAAFVESNREALRCINDNIIHTHFAEKSKVYPMDYKRALLEIHTQNECFDIIFMDPPYGKGLEIDALKFLREYEIVDDNSIVIVEAPVETIVSSYEACGYSIYKVKKYKTNKHVFLRKGDI